jgi:excisionase family DNA binding protein
MLSRRRLMPNENVQTMSIPEAGAHYFGLSRGGSYDAADRGEIPFIRIGRLRRVPVRAMERMMEKASNKVDEVPHERPAAS